MCGIAGILDLDLNKVDRLDNSLCVMNSLHKHRGPDGEGVCLNSNKSVGFGHVRLSIIDHESGQQPMSSDSGCTITYNGEIYNFQEIRNELSDSNYKTKSDTEVILKSYERWEKIVYQSFVECSLLLSGTKGKKNSFVQGIDPA